MRPYRYLAWMGGTVIGLCCLAVALAVAVDPYRLYGTPTVAGWTALKPRIETHYFMSKLHQLERVRPNTLLLGNSRVEVGLDPRSGQWRASDRPVYNAALAGRGLRASLDMLRDAIAAHPPRTVVLGLDFMDFLQRPDPLPPPAPPVRVDERRLLVDGEGKPNPERPLQLWRDRLATTLTIDAILDSLATLFEQDPRYGGTITPLGFNPLHEYRAFSRQQGYDALFAQWNRVYVARYRERPAPDFAEPRRYASFRYLEEIMALCRSHAIRLLMFIHPYHADYLEMLREDALWPSFVAWKRALVKVTAAEMPAGWNDLFDFSGYNAFTTEPVPPPGDRRTAMRWYWEAGHYKSALGEVMLARMLHGAPGFGLALNAATLARVLRQGRAGASGYVAPIEAVSLPAAASPR